MSYIIHKTDGTILTEVIDGLIDQISTDVTLLGKNATSYGEFWNENFVHILENFANITSPNNPLIGQLWFDTTENRIKVYDGSGFRVATGTIVAATAPSTLASGDLWIDSANKQLYFNDGVSNVLAGPVYSSSQGVCGFFVDSVIDTQSIPHTIVKLYVSDTLLGIFSKTAFTPNNTTPIPGFTKSSIITIASSSDATTDSISVSSISDLYIGLAVKFSEPIGGLDISTTYYVLAINTDESTSSSSFTVTDTINGTTAVSLTTQTIQSRVLFANLSNDIKVGFNAGLVNGMKFNSISTLAEGLVDSHGNISSTDSFLSAYNDTIMTGSLTINNETPLILGSKSQSEVYVSDAIVNIKSNIQNQNFSVSVNSAGTYQDAIFVRASTKQVGVFTNAPGATMDINGDLIVRGAMTVKGTVTAINTTNLEISDKLIELGKTATPTDVTATGGGIKIQGDTVKSLTWENTLIGWKSSDNFTIASGKALRINNVVVVEETALGSSIASAPGLTSVGTLTSLQVDSINVNSETISTTSTNTSLFLSPNGVGTVDVSNSRITSVANGTEDTDAVNKSQLNALVRSAPLAISMDITAFGINTETRDVQIAIYLLEIFPEVEHDTDTLCRVMCTNSGVISVRTFQLTSAGIWLNIDPA